MNKNYKLYFYLREGIGGVNENVSQIVFIFCKILMSDLFAREQYFRYLLLQSDCVLEQNRPHPRPPPKIVAVFGSLILGKSTFQNSYCPSFAIP